MKVKSNSSSPWVNQSFTLFSKFFNSHSITVIWMTQFFLFLKVCSHNVCVLCMRHIFSNKRIEKSCDVVFLGMICKIKSTRHTSKLQWDSVTLRWAEKKKKKKTKTAKQTTNWARFSLTEAMKKSKNR